MADVSLFTPLPGTASTPPVLPSGTVALFDDDNWSSTSIWLMTADYRMGERHTISRRDQATYLAFNLPVGTVMTLTDDVAGTDGHQAWDLRSCGRCVDLVGTGETVGVDLRPLGMDDCLSMMFWRTVDLDLGAIEMFDDASFGGNRVTLFLSEWQPGVAHSIDGWWLQDRVSSVRWRTLSVLQMASLFSEADGTGNSFTNIRGSGNKEIGNLDEVDFNDRVSSFRWDSLLPVKEIIAPFTMQIVPDLDQATALRSEVAGTNDTDLPQPVTVSLNDAKAQTLTVTTTDTHTANISMTMEYNWSVGTDATGKTGGKLSLTLSYSYTHSDTTSNSTTDTLALSVSQTVNAPPHSRFAASLIAQIGKVRPTAFQTTAQRWYTHPESGGTSDPENHGWYKRIEPVTGTIEGGLACQAQTVIKATPLGETQSADAA